MDSSVVVALSNTTPSLSMNTYTAFWENAPDKMDERVFAKSVANRYGCTYREIGLSFDSFDRNLPLLAWHLEEPNADGAFVPTFLISQLAHEHGKVVLTGGGGDELFAGYAWYRSDLPVARRLKQFMKWGWWQTGRSVYTSRAFSFPWTLIIPEYERGVAGEFINGYAMMPSADELNRQMAYDLKTWLKDDILLLTDKVTMAASIEARVPLLDHRVVEFVLGLPSTYKLTESDNKLILKQATASYLPEDILNRRKDGFGAPIGSWMEGQFKTLCRDVLRNGELVKRGIIDTRSLDRVSQLSSIRKAWGWGLWVLLNLELWFRFVVEPCPRPDGVRLSDLR
jgi:asparagine synthase (glutamine-hydrolysing)